jgi:predicted Fe-Mo cluster-binding NifX family protein
MPKPACPFCPKSRRRPVSWEGPEPPTIEPVPIPDVRTAVPAFMGRVSPVFDTCTQLILLEPGSANQLGQRSVAVADKSMHERVLTLQRMGVERVICAAVSDAFFTLLQEARIELVTGIAGEIDEVIDAYRSGALGQSRFRMPGSPAVQT